MSKGQCNKNVLHVEEDDDAMLIEAANTVERQLAHQEQLGGSLSASEPGRFEFTLNPYVDRRSHAMGVRERHYLSHVRQVGRFVPQQHLAAALRDGLHRALQNLILCERIPEQDRVYFSLTSNRLNNNYDYRGLPASEWMNGSDRVDSMLQQMSRMLNSNENFEMEDSFQLSFTHVRRSPNGSGSKRKMKPVTPIQKPLSGSKRVWSPSKQRQSVLCSSHCHCQSQRGQSS